METRLYMLLGLSVLAGCVYAAYTVESPPVYCTNVLQGYKTKFSIRMETTSLSQGIRDFEIEIPQITVLCKPERQTGVRVSVCDYSGGGPPQVLLKSFTQAVIHRLGNLNTSAPLDVTTYCKYK